MQDSLIANFGGHLNNFMNPLNPGMLDSAFMKKFQLNQDSLLNYHLNFQNMFPQDFDFPDI